MVEKNISLMAVRRILLSAGPSRVSEGAIGELREVLEEVGFRISKEAVSYLAQSGRKTVKLKDIKIAPAAGFKRIP